MEETCEDILIARPSGPGGPGASLLPSVTLQLRDTFIVTLRVSFYRVSELCPLMVVLLVRHGGSCVREIE